MPPKARVLLVDDSPQMTQMLAERLGELGFEVAVADDGESAIELARKTPFDVVVTDLRMGKLDGLDVLDAIRAIDASTPVLIMTAFGGVESAIDAIKRGAFHYLTKPFQFQELVVYLERALSDRALRFAHKELQRVAGDRARFASIQGRSEPMQALFGVIERAAPTNAPVLITGESGTGKELVARAIHFESVRRDRAFVAVNCTALPEALLESELFGHARGAFTGATGARRGLFAEADGGTLFLDEIGDMPPALQAKLLRVLEDGEVRAVGADGSRRVDVRVIAATNQALDERIRAGQFRADLFYRLRVVPIAVPALRDRREDIAALTENFLVEARRRTPSAIVERLAPDAHALFLRARWPGNVRQLKHIIEQLVIVVPRPEVTVDDIARFAPELIIEDSPLERAKQSLPTLRDLESEYIDWVLDHCQGNKARAAEILGLDKSTLHRRERRSQ